MREDVTRRNKDALKITQNNQYYREEPTEKKRNIKVKFNKMAHISEEKCSV